MSLLLATALVAGAFVLMALKTIVVEMDYAQRCDALREEAHVLREKQMERLRSLRPQRR